MADNMHFTSREKLEVFIRQNPKRFLEELERSPDLRNNFQQLLQDWNNGDLIKIAQLLQGIEVRNPINNKLMIVEEKAKSFYHWSFNELREVQQNPYHKLSSFQHYLHETMKKREELDEEEEKERLRKEKEHKVQSKFDKDRLEQEKVNMHIVMKTIEAQFKQSLQHLVANMNVKALQKLAEDLQPHFDSLKVNHKYNQFNLAWKKTAANVFKNVPNSDKLVVIVESVGAQFFDKLNNSDAFKKLNILFQSLGMKDSEEILERIKNGTATDKDMETLLKTLVANRKNPNVKEVFGDFEAVTKGDRQSIEQFQQNTLSSINNLRFDHHQIKQHQNEQPEMVQNKINNLVNNIRNTTLEVKNSHIETDVSNNIHVEGETFKLKGNKI